MVVADGEDGAHEVRARRDAVALLLRRMPLDATDRRLIELLQHDGRLPFNRLARELGVTERTARRHFERLTAAGVFQITAVTTPEVLGYHAIAIVGVELDGTRGAGDVAAELAGFDASDYVVVATGRYPIYVELFCRDRAELARVVDQQVRALPGVRSAEVFLYLRLHYQQAQFARARAGADGGGVRPRALGALDRAIIGVLTHDGRTPFLRIAEQLGVSESQVRQRVRQIIEGGHAEIIAIVNPLGLGYDTTAWLALRVASGATAAAVADRLADLPAITYVAICAGRFDIFAEAVCLSNTELLELVDREVRGMPGVADVEVAVYLDLHYKRLLPLGEPER